MHNKTMNLLIKRLVALLACISLSVSGTSAVLAQATLFNNDAQSDASHASRIILAAVDPTPELATTTGNLGFDITAPSITHSPPISKGVAGEVQTVVAEISDNQAVERALLIYRNSSADFFSTVAMSADITNTTWLATVDTSTDDTAVQYYIVAEDTDGNRVQKGSEGNPLILELQQTELFSAISPAKKDNRNTWIGIGLGVLIVAALASKSSSDDPEGQLQSDDTCCIVKFVVPNVSTD